MLSGKSQSLSMAPGPFAPILNAVLSVPVAFLFSLAVPGEAFAFVVVIVSLGLLTSLDLRLGSLRLVLGFAVAFLASLYALENSFLAQGLSNSVYGGWSLLFVAIPPSLGVLVAGFLLSDENRYKMIFANVVASIGLAIGFGIGSSIQIGGIPSFDRALSPPIALLLLAFPANGIQIVLLHFLNKLWKARKFSLVMMPTAFFALNLLNFYTFFISKDLTQLYPFLSSLGFLPALVLLGVGSGTLARKMSGGGRSSATVATPRATVIPTRPAAPASLPTIMIRGDSTVRQGRDQRINVATQSGGKRRDMASLDATVTRPGGATDSLKLLHVSKGEYRASYRPGTTGSYTVRVAATSKEHQNANESFSFTAQGSPSKYSAPPRAFSQSRSLLPLPPASPRPSAPPPLLRPSIPQTGPGASKLDNWDPRVWVGQEVHGYLIKQHLATGLTGYVLQASFGQSGTEMAIKIPILTRGTAAHALDETMSEATRLLELSEQSKYVVQLRGILVDRLNVQEILKGDTGLYLKNPPAIIMELMKGGTAKKLVEDLSYESLTYSEKWGSIVLMIGQMIATGLDTIHRAGFVHLDVKPQNILFNVKPPTTGADVMDQLRSGTLLPKLADLGSAVKVGGKISQFTSEYAPGEQVLGSSAAASMDVYALGATIYNLLSKTPINSKRLIDAMNKLTISPESNAAASDLRSTWNSFEPDFARISNFPSAIPVLKKMLAREPQNRPDAGNVATSLRNLS